MDRLEEQRGLAIGLEDRRDTCHLLGRHAELGSWGSWVWYGAETGCSCVSVCVCDPQTPKEFKVEMEETREVNIETVTAVISNIQ